MRDTRDCADFPGAITFCGGYRDGKCLDAVVPKTAEALEGDGAGGGGTSGGVQAVLAAVAAWQPCDGVGGGGGRRRPGQWRR